jgi:hypothetical protein
LANPVSYPAPLGLTLGGFSQAHAILLLDGAGWHGARALAVPELNPVENVWAYFRANKLAIIVFDTYDDIVDACYKAWNFFAKDPDTIVSITSGTGAKVS